MLLVIIAGWALRRRGYLDDAATSRWSRILVDVSFPALAFGYLLRTVNRSTLLQHWYVPFVGGGIIVLGEIVGAAAAPLVCPRDQRRTFVFLVAMPNWIFLPLPIALALHGQEGVQTVLLINVGAMIVLWTLGVFTLRGRPGGAAEWRQFATNAGLWATLLAVALVLLVPDFSTWLNGTPATAAAKVPVSASSLGLAALRALSAAIDFVGSMTVPLSLVLSGSQLATAPTSKPEARGNSKALLGWLLGLRLLVVPVLFAAILGAAALAGLHAAPIPLRIAFIVAAMPAAASCPPFAERFGGDASLAARTVVVTTVVGLLTVPALFWIFERLLG